MITVGRFQIASVINGRLGLDGGAMFGVVPKVLWERKTKPDDQNRIPLAMRTLVAVDAQAGRVILVDTGAGHKWPADEADRFAIKPDPSALSQALVARGLTEADVTDLVITHLHFDHNGGLTEWVEGSTTSTRLRFPRARHWIHEKHWRHANSPTEKDGASFLKRDLEALADPEVLTLVTGEEPDPPFEGLHWQLSHGHTPYQLLPVFEGTDRDLLFVGDMIPTANHLPAPWVMAYDLEPLVTIAEKTRTLRRCGESGLALAFPHDPDLGGVTVELIKNKPIIKQRLDL